jgi:regulatory protein
MADAYTYALTLLARRELCEAQIRERLVRRGFSPEEVDTAAARLHADRSLDDDRTARAFARTETRLKHRSRLWILQRLHRMGIARGTAASAVSAVFEDLDEQDLLDATLDRRLRGGASVADPAVQRRLHRYLLAQGFDAGRIVATLRARARSTD